MDGEEDNPFRRAKEAFNADNYGFETLSSLTQLYETSRHAILLKLIYFRSSQTQRHLQHVYGNLTLTTFLAAIACYLGNTGIIGEPGFLALALFFVTFLAAMFMRDTPSNSMIRHGALYGMGFSQGWLVSPLVSSVLLIDPNTVLMTIVATVLIFGSFTMSAFYSPRRQYMYLGGILGTIVSLMMLTSLMNAWIGSSMLASAELYVGLLVFSLYVLYDTQIIVERAEGGRRDPVLHALMLFTDLAAIFVRLLIILVRNRNDDSGGSSRGQGGGRRPRK